MALIPADDPTAPPRRPSPPPPKPPIIDVTKLRCANCHKWLCRVAHAAGGRWWAIAVPRRNQSGARGYGGLHIGTVYDGPMPLRCNNCSYVNNIQPQR